MKKQVLRSGKHTSYTEITTQSAKHVVFQQVASIVIPSKVWYKYIPLSLADQSMQTASSKNWQCCRQSISFELLNNDYKWNKWHIGWCRSWVFTQSCKFKHCFWWNFKISVLTFNLYSSIPNCGQFKLDGKRKAPRCRKNKTTLNSFCLWNEVIRQMMPGLGLCAEKGQRKQTQWASHIHTGRLFTVTGT